MTTTPRLISRYERRVELTLPDKSGIRGYLIGAANTLDTAFAGTTAMFEVPVGQSFRSPYIRGRRWHIDIYTLRTLTHVLYDPEDYWPLAPAVLPHDADISFVTASEVDPAGVVGLQGPILVAPPPAFFTSPRPSLSVAGTAPDVPSTPTGLPPAGAMRFVLPRFSDNVRIRNLGGTTLYVAFGSGMPEIQIPAGTSETLYDAVTSEVFVHGVGAPVPFDARFAIVNGEMA